jgi:FtsP/CotA-like multicopper oxidase with cupredoxin domain
VATINGKMLGSGDPVKVKQGERVMMHILNSSPTEVHWISFSGHSFKVVALDGNPVAQAQAVSMLRLAPAERVSAIVEMNNPGVWVLGEVRKHVPDSSHSEAAGMRCVCRANTLCGKGRVRSAPEIAPDPRRVRHEQERSTIPERRAFPPWSVVRFALICRRA